MPPPLPPIAPLTHVFTPFFGRIQVVTHVEVVFSPARTSCCSLLDLIVRRHDMQYDRRFFPYAAGGSGAKLSPNRSRAEVWWGSRWQSPLKLQKSGILRYKIQPKNSTLWSVSLNLKEKTIDFMFQTSPITRLHKCSQVKSKILKLTLHFYIINIHQTLLKLYGCRSP